MQPLECIIEAYVIFNLAFKFVKKCDPQQPQITPEMFRNSLPIKTGGRGVVIPEENFSQQVLEGRARNLLQSALGTLLITIDEAADEIWGSKNSKAVDDLGKARNILYMLRCAYAHGPVEPKWVIKKVYQEQIQLNLPGEIAINFRADLLNGQPFVLDDIGGLEGLVALIQFIVEESNKSKIDSI